MTTTRLRIRDENDEVLGWISIIPGRKTLRASRLEGTDTDCRRIADGFRTLETAEAWIRLSEVGQ